MKTSSILLASTLLLSGGLGPITLPAAPVEARLLVPPAPTYVIGDDIPLLWEFTNQGREPLAFLWEGCCRLNGRLTVTREEETLAPIPPGPSVAHQFAKAERLDPNSPAQFATKLSDWVKLHASGTYRLQGHYVGVLPEQQPQIPGKLRLWREAALTPPLRVEVLSPQDYLAQGPTRAKQRGLELTLAGPDSLPPLEPIQLQLTFQNHSPEPISVAWPGPSQLWILNPHGERIGVHFIKVDSQTLSIPPGRNATVSFPLETEDLLDAPFGAHQVFVDLAEGDSGQPRLPSNALTISWNLDSATVQDLLQQASLGPQTGLRNKPLKLLRVYLAELRPVLETLSPTSLPPAAGNLLLELRRAACLKAYAPVPGTVELLLTGSPSAPWDMDHPTLRSCLTDTNPNEDVINHLNQIIATRRHLGWTLQPLVQPSLTSSLSQIFALNQQLQPLQADLGGPLRSRLVFTNAAGPVTNLLTFQNRPIPATLILKISSDPPAARMEMARKDSPIAAGRFPVRAGIQPRDLGSLAFQTLPSASDLDALLDDPKLGFPQTLVLAAPDLNWSQLVEMLGPFTKRGLPVDVTAWPPSSP